MQLLGPEGRKTLLQKVVSTTEVQLGELNEGKYEWSVRAVDRLKRRGEAMPARNFSISYGDPLPAPEPQSEIFQ